MKILKSAPKADGFYMPAEFSPHCGCIILWPHRRDSWQYGGYAARRVFAETAAAIARSERVTICTPAEHYANARALLPDHIRVVEMESDDSWARDTAPTFVTNGREIRGVDWGFNAWGGLEDGLYYPWSKDSEIARKICDLYEKDVYDARNFILEGGSIHSDGEGTILTTEACLLSRGRNPKLTKKQIEEKLCSFLGAEKVIWLKHGILDDETNEHVDNICAFIAPAEVVLAWTDDRDDPQYEMSKGCLDVLENTTDARGRKIKVHKLPLPKPVHITEEECMGLDLMDGKPVRTPGDRLAASYVNFYIANSAVICPQFGDDNDKQALEILQRLFPTRRVMGIYARDILIGGGNIHCITQQIPCFEEK